MLKEKIWAWGHKTDGHYGNYTIDQHSEATPMQGAKLYNAANALMVMPCSEEEAAEVRKLDKVIWSITAEDNFDYSATLDYVKRLAQSYPNIKGVIIDDLTSMEIAKGMTPEDLAKVREQVKSSDTPLELWGVLYSMNFELPRIEEYMALLDVVTFWTWDSKDLVKLEEDFARAEQIVNGKPIVLGLYVYDFGGVQEMPLDRMKYQCDIALKWLQEGRVAGVILLATCEADLPYEAVQYAHEWSERVSQLPG